MKKVLSFVLGLLVLTTITTAVIAKDKTTNDSTTTTTTKKVKVGKKDVIKDDEYKQIKTQFFNADGYGNMYNCKVEKQRFCKVKDLDTGLFVLCDREVSRTQMESAKVFYKLGRCVKLN